MAFFNNSIVTEGYNLDNIDMSDVPVYEGTEMESEGIYCDHIKECYALESAMYIADSMMERAVFEGADASVLVENAITDVIDKVKEFILKMWKKLVAWVTSVRDKLRLALGASSKFVSKHKDDLEKKLASNPDFKYTGYTFTWSVNKDIQKFITDSVATDSTIKSIVGKYGTNVTVSDYINMIDSSHGASTIADLGAAFTKKFNGDKDSPSEIKQPQINIETMLSELKNAATINDGIRTTEANAKTAISKIIKELDKAKSDAKKVKAKTDDAKEDKANNIELINVKIRLAKLSSSIVGKLTTVAINNAMRVYKQYNSVARSISGLADNSKKAAASESAIDFALKYFG